MVEKSLLHDSGQTTRKPCHPVNNTEIPRDLKNKGLAMKREQF